MNRNNLLQAASEWTRCAKNDIRKKVRSFIESYETTPEEFAEAIGISDGELYNILDGSCDISINTFAKLLIATGNALEIKPIEETPLCDYRNIEGRGFDPRPNIFDEAPQRHRPNHPQPQIDEEADRFARSLMEDEERHFHCPSFGRPSSTINPMRFHPQPQREPQQAESPFRAMTYDHLINIIKNKLWDSEIDLRTASREDLIKFLDAKDKKIQEMRRRSNEPRFNHEPRVARPSHEMPRRHEPTAQPRREEPHRRAIDPSVNAFKERIRSAITNNPQLKKWVEELVGDEL